MKKEDFDFGFDFGDSEDISSSKKSTEYEDINSYTKYVTSNEGAEKRMVTSHAKSSKKRKPVNKTLRYKIKKWWRCLKKGEKAALISVTSLVMVVVLAVVWFFTYFDYNYNNITDDPEDLGFTEVIDEKIVNIALFGIDTRNLNTFKGNSDSIMILSLNTKTKKIKIISVMRDTLVPIERKGKKTTYSKINAAYAWGGAELAISTLNKVFNLDISEYATVNFYGMVDIINAVGGIDAEITQAEINSKKGINFCTKEICDNLGLKWKDYDVSKPGLQHLNGVQAVAYARIRSAVNVWGTNNDYGRTDRQRYVMEQLFNKAVTLKKSEYVKLAKSLIPCSETSLSYGEIMSLATSILLHSPTFEQTRMPQEDFLMTSPKGSFGSVVYFDLDFAAKAIHAVIYDDMTLEQFVEQNGIEKNNWYAATGNSGSGRPSSTQNSSNTTSSKPTSSSNSSSKEEEDESSAISSGNESNTSSGAEGSSSDNTSGTVSGGSEPDDGEGESGGSSSSSGSGSSSGGDNTGSSGGGASSSSTGGSGNNSTPSETE